MLVQHIKVIKHVEKNVTKIQNKNVKCKIKCEKEYIENNV